MKFILGLLIGGGLVFGWYYMHGASNADCEVQLKAAADQVESLNKELLKTRADLVAVQAKHANIFETVYVSPRLEQSVSKPVVVTVPVSPAPLPVSVPSKVAQPAPTEPANVARVKK